MQKNVLIPLSLLVRIICLFDNWDTSNCNYDIRYEYGDILWALKVKMQKLDLRDAYAQIIMVDNQEDRDLARIEYLQQKNQLGDVDAPVLF